jgi:hypothetical protein
MKNTKKPRPLQSSFDPDKILEAYEEASGHLDACACEEEDKQQKEAYREVARRIRRTCDRVNMRRI